MGYSLFITCVWEFLWVTGFFPRSYSLFYTHVDKRFGDGLREEKGDIGELLLEET
jgi:hypothetical protein